MSSQDDLRSRLVAIALEWEKRFGIAPAITSALSEYDAAMLVGMTEQEFGLACCNRTAVSRGWDFLFKSVQYQVKANRPSGKPGSPVTKVGQANNYEWDRLIWILYDSQYTIQEAWIWDVQEYRKQFDTKTRLSPADMRRGVKLYPAESATAA